LYTERTNQQLRSGSTGGFEQQGEMPGHFDTHSPELVRGPHATQ
jgi:hypothetical protein